MSNRLWNPKNLASLSKAEQHHVPGFCIGLTKGLRKAEDQLFQVFLFFWNIKGLHLLSERKGRLRKVQAKVERHQTSSLKHQAKRGMPWDVLSQRWRKVKHGPTNIYWWSFAIKTTKPQQGVLLIGFLFGLNGENPPTQKTTKAMGNQPSQQTECRDTPQANRWRASFPSADTWKRRWSEDGLQHHKQALAGYRSPAKGLTFSGLVVNPF